MGDFEKDLKSGAIGERVAWDLLIKAKNARSVVDVRDDRRFQQYDVDFLCEMADRNFKWFEVKTDFRAHETRFTEVSMGDYAKGFLVPIRALEDYGIVIKKWEGLE